MTSRTVHVWRRICLYAICSNSGRQNIKNKKRNNLRLRTSIEVDACKHKQRFPALGGSLARLGEMNSIPGTRAGSPRRDLAMSLVSLENSPRVYMGTRASPGRRDLRMLKVDLAYSGWPVFPYKREASFLKKQVR